MQLYTGLECRFAGRYENVDLPFQQPEYMGSQLTGNCDHVTCSKLHESAVGSQAWNYLLELESLDKQQLSEEERFLKEPLHVDVGCLLWLLYTRKLCGSLLRLFRLVWRIDE